MKLSDFIRYICAEKKISAKDISAMMGYTEPSFRNKLTKNNFNLRDVIILGLLTDMQLSLTDESNTQAFSFDPLDYLDDLDMERLNGFIENNLKNKQIMSWFESLSDEEKEKIYNDQNEVKTQPNNQ